MRIAKLLVFAQLAAGLLLRAADPTGTITGTVVDPSAAAVVGARVIVTNQGTGFTRQATTAMDGGYVFPLLPVGTYEVTVEISGFRRFEQRGVEVKTDISSSVPVTLEVGSISDSITVEANAAMVDRRSGTLSQVVGRQWPQSPKMVQHGSVPVGRPRDIRQLRAKYPIGAEDL